MKKFFLFTLLCVITMTTQAQTNLSDYLTKRMPKRETRAVWLTTLANLDWPKNYARSEESIKLQKQELIDILDKYQKANINTVLLQARVRAATIYPSDIEPWDQCITGVEGRAPGYGYDPLSFAVEECHKRGMEIHAWIATIPVGAKNSLGCRTLMKKGFRIRNFSTGSYLDPADPSVAPYLASICGEIVRKYDVDGINLDYIRYPDGWPRPSYRDGDTPDQRRSNITAIVRAIHDEVKAIKPWVKMSCSPIGKHADLSRYSSKNFNAHDRVSQEAQEWMRLGLMDQLYPMQYFRGDNYYPFVADWVENAYKREIVTGLGTYFLDPREGNWTLGDLTRQMYVSRDLGVGHAHFRSYFLTANKQGVYDFEKQFNATLSLPHKMQGVVSTAAMPYAVNSSLVERREDKSVILRWKAVTPYYNIYASYTYPVDTEDARNLLFARYTGQMLQLKNVNPNLYFAVRGMDRYGLETPALQENMKSSTLSKSPATLLANDGNTLTLPAAAKLTDADRYVILSLQGVILRIVNAKSLINNQLYIGSLSDGMYSLKVYNHKKKSFTLGAFMVKRGS
ncbi:glycoside hydrolase family 10 protein [Prevotella melaninogenica]|uniref:glycoside hydrolase family 10 protein n=1 Tax=Prevotella melaninogenica TaxID=28132 RepID=UPI001C603C08|nr:family 10 glycosylhydrolase [Prevotella melaninogenica]MBW4728925.1 family 10 glycosylhydrolase [Prevotella melaninogenica]MBW4731308.1 family 10 glycosylhydrolase [Prevotella melaninogenica]MBW4749466.1 family 10 glycosylhydrolase [Prevotella melaninogenica]